jgi:hypothetical protein
VAQAQSYPAPLLYRAFNEFNADICAYRNRELDLGRIIIIYDADERLAVVRARTRSCDAIYAGSGTREGRPLRVRVRIALTLLRAVPGAVAVRSPRRRCFGRRASKTCLCSPAVRARERACACTHCSAADVAARARAQACASSAHVTPSFWTGRPLLRSCLHASPRPPARRGSATPACWRCRAARAPPRGVGGQPQPARTPRAAAARLRWGARGDDDVAAPSAAVIGGAGAAHSAAGHGVCAAAAQRERGRGRGRGQRGAHLIMYLDARKRRQTLVT